MKTKDLNLAYKLRHALDESANNLPDKTSERLSSARNIALSRKKPEFEQTVSAPRLIAAGHGNGMHSSFQADTWFSWLGRMGVVVPLAALVFGLMGLFQYEKHQQIIEAATIDAEVLTDDLPLSAYLDHGFDAFLANSDEE
jgi:hypothetical protein